jgi:hypothetical protein
MDNNTVGPSYPPPSDHPTSYPTTSAAPSSRANGCRESSLRPQSTTRESTPTNVDLQHPVPNINTTFVHEERRSRSGLQVRFADDLSPARSLSVPESPRPQNISHTQAPAVSHSTPHDVAPQSSLPPEQNMQLRHRLIDTNGNAIQYMEIDGMDTVQHLSTNSAATAGRVSAHLMHKSIFH